MLSRIRWSRPSFFVIFVAAFLLGAAFRVEPQAVAAMHGQAPSEVASSSDYVVIDNGDHSPKPQNAMAGTVVDFYRAVINAEFAHAYDLSMENRWGTTSVVGLQPRAPFVAALNDEIGSEGLPVGIVRLAVDWERPLHIGANTMQTYPELQTLRFVSAGTRISSPQLAHVSGRLVGNCAISGFARTDVVVQINGQWKVLLPGRRHPNDPHFEEWFLPHTHMHAHFRST